MRLIGRDRAIWRNFCSWLSRCRFTLPLVTPLRIPRPRKVLPMFEILSMTLGLEIGPRAASVWLGLALGVAFGALAFLTRFCLRRALVGPLPAPAPRRHAQAVAILGTQIAVAAGRDAA